MMACSSWDGPASEPPPDPGRGDPGCARHWPGAPGTRAEDGLGQGPGAPRGAAEWRQFLKFDGINAVVAAIPCDLSARLYLDVLAAGKDLYGEKPMCLTPGDLPPAAFGRIDRGPYEYVEPYRYIITMTQGPGYDVARSHAI